jgi:hypothetical protein
MNNVKLSLFVTALTLAIATPTEVYAQAMIQKQTPTHDKLNVKVKKHKYGEKTIRKILHIKRMSISKIKTLKKKIIRNAIS